MDVRVSKWKICHIETRRNSNEINSIFTKRLFRSFQNLADETNSRFLFLQFLSFAMPAPPNNNQRREKTKKIQDIAKAAVKRRT